MERNCLFRKAHLDDVKDAMHGLLLVCVQKGMLRPRSGLGGSGENLFPGGARRSASPGVGAADDRGLSRRMPRTASEKDLGLSQPGRIGRDSSCTKDEAG